MMRCHGVVPVFIAGWLGVAGSAGVQAGSSLPIDTVLARRYFGEAAELTRRDGGALWGRPLTAPLLFVDPASRALLAQVPDAEERLHPLGGFYTGVLPAAESAANTAVGFGGRTWAMVVWPPSRDSLERNVLFAHELWHRIQDSLGLPAANPSNPHLATQSGRLWLRLEGRALRRALDVHGLTRIRALRDALLFRQYRRSFFPGSDSTERQLELNEGLAEYTGIVLATASGETRQTLVLKRLATLDSASHLERTFAYQTGPVYGRLLDELAPGWRSTLHRDQDLALRLGAALGVPGGMPTGVVARAGPYGYALVRRAESARAAARRAHLAAVRARFVRRPILELPLGEMKLGFDPGKVEALDSLGTLYGNLHLSDRWGVVQCDSSGGLISADWSRLVVPAPADTGGRRLTGPGWVLQLAPGWRLAPGKRPGDWKVTTDQRPDPGR